MLGDEEVTASKSCGPACLTEAVKWSVGVLRQHLVADWGDHGACSTDQGPEHVTANTGTMPAILALRSALGLDFAAGPDTRASWILPHWDAQLVASTDGGAYFPHRGEYEHTAKWSEDGLVSGTWGWSTTSSHLLGMGILQPNNQTALGAAPWTWNNVIEPDAAQRTYGMGYSPYAKEPIYGMVYWPELTGTKEVNPQSAFGLNIVDEFEGFYIMRTGYKDSNDAMVTFVPGGRGGKVGHPNGNSCYDMLGGVAWYALGQRFAAIAGGSKYGGDQHLPVADAAAVKAFKSALNAMQSAKQETYRQLDASGGGGILSFVGGGKEWSFVSDFSGKSGAELLFVLSGNATDTVPLPLPHVARNTESAMTGWRAGAGQSCPTTSPAQGNVVTTSAGGRTFYVLTIQCGSPPAVHAQGVSVTIGDRTISYNGGHLILQ